MKQAISLLSCCAFGFLTLPSLHAQTHAHSARSNFFELDLREAADFEISAASGIIDGIATSYGPVHLDVANVPSDTARVNYFVGNTQVGFSEGSSHTFDWVPLHAGPPTTASVIAEAVDEAGGQLDLAYLDNITLQHPARAIEPEIMGPGLPEEVRVSGSLFDHLHKRFSEGLNSPLVVNDLLESIQLGNRRGGIWLYDSHLIPDGETWLIFNEMPIREDEEGDNWSFDDFRGPNSKLMVVGRPSPNMPWIHLDLDQLMAWVGDQVDKKARGFTIVNPSESYLEKMGIWDGDNDPEFMIVRRPSFVREDIGYRERRAEGVAYSEEGTFRNARKLFIVIHGHNRKAEQNPIRTDNFDTLMKNLQEKIGVHPQWHLLGYDWSQDGATGSPIFPRRGQDTLLNFAESAARAAAIGYMHGLFLGKTLVKNDNLEEVQLIAHSAGTWVIYGVVQQLLAHEKPLENLQITLLDPFWPTEAGRITGVQSFFGPHMFLGLIEENLASVANPRLLDHYYVHDIITGNATRAPGLVDNYSHSGRVRTIEPFREEQFRSKSYENHDGPVIFYGDTVAGINRDSRASVEGHFPVWNLDTDPGWDTSLFALAQRKQIQELKNSQTIGLVTFPNNRTANLFSSSDSAFGQTLDIPDEGALLAFRFAYPVAGPGDQLQVRINGETIWSYDGVDYVYDGYLTSGEISLDAYAGQTVDWEIRLRSVSGEEAEATVTDLRFYQRPYNLMETNKPSVSMDAEDRIVPAGSALELSAAVFGPGPVNLQWQRDGQSLSGETDGTLAISGAATLTEGMYRLRAENAFGVAYGPEIEIRVDSESELPVITEQPQSVTVDAGESVSFSFDLADPDDDGLAIQWYREETPVDGATGLSLSLSSVGEADAGFYFAIVANDAGEVLTASASLTVQVLQAPEITAHPVGATVDFGRAVAFAVAATGYPAPTYQWLKDGVPLSGATSDRLVLRNLDLSEAGAYSVELSNNVGTVVSDSAEVEVVLPSYSLTLNVHGEGTVAAAPDQSEYESGTEVTLTATAASGHAFDNWSGNASGTTNPLTVEMDGDKTITAGFVQITAPEPDAFQQLVLGTEFEGFRFLSSTRFSFAGEDGSEFTGDWTYEATGPGSGRLAFELDDVSPGEDRFEVDFTFGDPASGEFVINRNQAGEIEEVSAGGFALDFDFFQLPRKPGMHQRESFWFGRFNDEHFDHDTNLGWIRHEEHGWLYAAGRGAAESLWLFDYIELNWLWTRADIYPFFFSHDNQDWLFYFRGGRPEERQFFDYRPNENRWMLITP